MYRIVLVHGVVIFPMMNVVSEVVTTQAVQTVLAYQMVTAGKVTVDVLHLITPVMIVMIVLVLQTVMHG